jgi:hypothetical protein
MTSRKLVVRTRDRQSLRRAHATHHVAFEGRFRAADFNAGPEAREHNASGWREIAVAGGGWHARDYTSDFAG